ncbi:MAG: prepilin-type N-terminal cleavage/methylation domain-containing protein [Planctomycetes bacterium]|nr:prepilin-type N-terminal cleavage/methylation domain-containing protein [Planctomycetota bacterium]
MTQFRPRRGFTLIEVLVVVAIVALLISILIPSLANARELSKRAVCLSNLSQLGVASTGYINSNKNRFCWGWVDYSVNPPKPRFRSWYFGGDRPTGEGFSWWNPGAWYAMDASRKPLNRYVTPSKLGRNAALPVFRCPDDWGGAISDQPFDPPTPKPAYVVWGTSYQANTAWQYYAQDKAEPGWGQNLSGSVDEGDRRLLAMSDKILRIFEKKSASRAILLYEDRADISLAGAVDIPDKTKMPGWHVEPNRHAYLFVDAHAENFVLDFKKVMDHTSDQYGRVLYTCNAAIANCINGTPRWIARQDYKEQ